MMLWTTAICHHQEPWALIFKLKVKKDRGQLHLDKPILTHQDKLKKFKGMSLKVTASNLFLDVDHGLGLGTTNLRK